MSKRRKNDTIELLAGAVLAGAALAEAVLAGAGVAARGAAMAPRFAAKNATSKTPAIRAFLILMDPLDAVRTSVVRTLRK